MYDQQPTTRSTPAPEGAAPSAAPTAARSKERKAVYTIVDLGNGKPSRWIRIGIAFVNQDESLNVLLDALPVSGTLHVRDFPAREGEEFQS